VGVALGVSGAEQENCRPIKAKKRTIIPILSFIAELRK
jgi:hypothetical protein